MEAENVTATTLGSPGACTGRFTSGYPREFADRTLEESLRFDCDPLPVEVLAQAGFETAVRDGNGI